MDDIIHLLPDSVANQIAAGEVVQRPSSIIKEMVENSIDAEATNIQVLVVDGGKSNVQVIDDGKGMSETDARLSFERHATSKIRNAQDLFSLTTMGFRGEALASIAAVAQVELRTRRREDELGTYIQISGSKVENQEPVACPVGSNFSVKNLFFNVPARRKFMKSNQTELSNVVSDFQRIVLVHPHISFTLYNNGVEMFNLPSASVKQRIVDVFGKKMNQQLLPVDVETSLVSISGYVAKPECSKKKGALEYFFVNGRYMRHPYFHSAVMKAYEGLIAPGDRISYFIYLSVEPSTIDVNVHPTKTEIKFDNEQPIWQVLSATVKEAVGKFANVPMIDFDVEGRPDIPAMGSVTYNPQNISQMPVTYNPFTETSEADEADAQQLSSRLNMSPDTFAVKPSGASSRSSYGGGRLSSALNSTDNWERLYESAISDVPKTTDLWGNEASAGSNEVSALTYDPSLPVFQYKGKYLVFPDASGIVFVNQRRAHIRVLYDRYVDSLSDHQIPTQKSLFPEIVQFTKPEAEVLEGLMDNLCQLGFELSNLGGGAYSVSGTPLDVVGVDISQLLHDIVLAEQERVSTAVSDSRNVLAMKMAKAAAVVYGQVLTSIEMEQLLTDLFACKTAALTPDGKRIYAVQPVGNIDKMF